MNPYRELKEIFFEGVKRVNPYEMMIQKVHLNGSTLMINSNPVEPSQPLDLNQFDTIFVIGAGKATAKMALAIEHILGDFLTEGVISVKYGHTEPLKRIKTIEAGHPIPDDNSVHAARMISALAKKANERTLVVNLISGGGSALLVYPFKYESNHKTIELTLSEKKEMTKILLECGANINEINCIRKHLSMIKGGRLAQLVYPAVTINFILSDVIGDRLDTIASGPTNPDPTTFADMENIIQKYDLIDRIPEKVMTILKLGLNGLIPETPKSNDSIFQNVSSHMIGTNYMALQACEQKAKSYGYHTVILSSQIVGESREAAKLMCGIAKDIKYKGLLQQTPCCLIAGGETTVTIKGKGKGGRNQEFALSFLSEIENDPASAQGIYLLSASTDGNDGPTDAAGAFASLDVLHESYQKHLSINEYLKNNDAYRFFDQIGYLFKTGPTNTNVCDIQLILILE